MPVPAIEADPANSQRSSLVGLRSVGKSYGGVSALNGVSFDIETGTIHALAGENGAGKSTLIKAIAGATHPSAGSIVIDGREYAGLTPTSARAAGVRLVPQERHVCRDLAVLDNVLLGRFPKRWSRWGPISWGAARREASRRLQQVGLDLDPLTPMRDLTVAQMQVVEIARALSSNARLVIMDEPTAALSATDVRVLFDVMRRLRSTGTTFLYVSHHLEEVFLLADTVTVLRDGTHVVTRPTAGLAMNELIRLIIGRDTDASELRRAGASAAGAVPLEAQDVYCEGSLRGVSVQVRGREVLAVTGGLGSGRAELARCLVGADTPDSGRIVGPDGGVIRSRAHAARVGIAFLPSDRKHRGVLGGRDIVDNVDAGWLATSRSILDLPRRRHDAAAAQVSALNIKGPGLRRPIDLLSGGNQQKVLLARWLNVDMKALILDGPTEGIDIGSRFEIYRLLRDLAARGIAVVLFTSDLEEAQLVADRAIVMRRGRIAGELDGEAITEEALMSLEYGRPVEQGAG